jgi:hypothetical protein
MIKAADAVIWTNSATREVMVWPHAKGCPEEYPRWDRGHYWGDPIGAAYTAWHRASPAQRLALMLETVIDLAMQGYSIKTVLVAFAEIEEFRALGDKSYPMCRALTSALLGKCLEPDTMSFEELLKHYQPSVTE